MPLSSHGEVVTESLAVGRQGAGDPGPRAQGGGAIEAQVSTHVFGSDGPKPLQVLTDIDLHVHDHSFVSLIGPSGCGKTTLLRILGGLIRPTSGAVQIDGQPVTGPPPSVAMVFQDHNLLPWRKTLRNVEFGLELAGTPRQQRKELAMASLRRVGLAGFEDSFPAQLSGGMRQRVGLARALCLDPAILLMDEPFGALDILTREVMQDLLLKLWEEQRKTVVLVTHSVEEAVYLSDRVIVMTARPGHFKADVRIELARPRAKDPGIRVSSKVLEYRELLTELLRPELEGKDALE
jgi:NitT/TauT family transport system ATP-binding protein